MRKAAIISILIILTLNLTSCYDANEIDDMLHVVAIGIDKGISDKWRLTLQYPTMSGSSGGGGGGDTQSSGVGQSQGDYAHVTIDAPSFFTGIDMLNTSLPRRLTFTHAQLIVFSDELAKSGLVGEYIAPLKRFREIRDSAHVFVVKGKADEFLKENKPVIGSSISKDIETFVKESENTALFPHITLDNLYSGLKSPYHQPIATLAAINDFKSFQKEGEPRGQRFNTGGSYTAGELPRTGKNKIELFGTAVFDGDKMVGELTGDETRYMLMARGEFKRGFFTMQDPQKPELAITLDVATPKKPEIKVAFDDAGPIINIKIHLNADILAIQSMINYEQPKLMALLENEFQQLVKEGLETTIQKCQDMDADVFMFGDHATKKFLTINDLEKYNWNSHFRDAEITTEVKVTIRRTGTQIENYPIKSAEGAG